jgi:hypothetical protein
MSPISAATKRRLLRNIEIRTDQGVSLGTVKGQIRGRTEQEVEGGAAYYDAGAHIDIPSLMAAGIELRRYMQIVDPVRGHKFTVEAVRFIGQPGHIEQVECDLMGLQ